MIEDIIVGFLLTIGIGLIAFMIARSVIDAARARRRQDEPMVVARDDWEESRYKGRFCVNCGSALVAFQSADGYDFETGKPKFVSIYACPSAPNSTHIDEERWCAAGRNRRVWSRSRSCGHEEIDITCSDCQDRLTSAGIELPV